MKSGISVVQFVEAIRQPALDKSGLYIDFVTIHFDEREHEIFLLIALYLKSKLGTCRKTVDNNTQISPVVVNDFKTFEVSDEIAVLLELYGIGSLDGDESAAHELCLVSVKDTFELYKNVSPVESGRRTH